MDKSDSSSLVAVTLHVQVFRHQSEYSYLDCGDRLNCVRATDRLHSWLRKSEMLHLAFVNQFLHRTSYIFNRHVGINRFDRNKSIKSVLSRFSELLQLPLCVLAAVHTDGRPLSDRV